MLEPEPVPRPAVNQETHFRLLCERCKGQGGGADTISAPERFNCRSVNCKEKCPGSEMQQKSRVGLSPNGVIKEQGSLCVSRKERV